MDSKLCSPSQPIPKIVPLVILTFFLSSRALGILHVELQNLVDEKVTNQLKFTWCRMTTNWLAFSLSSHAWYLVPHRILTEIFFFLGCFAVLRHCIATISRCIAMAQSRSAWRAPLSTTDISFGPDFSSKFDREGSHQIVQVVRLISSSCVW